MKLGSKQRVPGCHCLDCGQLVDGATCVGADVAPGPGDATVCIYCGHLMVYDTERKLRDPTTDEIIQIAGDPRILAIQQARAKLKLET